LPLIQESFRNGPGPFAFQAAIAAQHCRASTFNDTNWPEIVRLYDLLEQVQPSPIVSLNRAVAVAMVDGPELGLALIDRIVVDGHLDDYHLLHATRADLYRRLGKQDEAVRSYSRALDLVRNNAERRFLERQLRDLKDRQSTSEDHAG